MSITIGYARVSLSDGRQDLAAQIASLEAAGCDRIFTDEISGTTAGRPGLTEALSHLGAGDRFVVRRLDRLGRSVPIITGHLEDLDDRGVAVVILDLGGGSLDTSSPTGRLLVSVPASVAQLERDLISVRTREALAARARAGVHIGRPPTPRETERAVIDLVSSGQTVTATARTAGVSRSTETARSSESAGVDLTARPPDWPTACWPRRGAWTTLAWLCAASILRSRAPSSAPSLSV